MKNLILSLVLLGSFTAAQAMEGTSQSAERPPTSTAITRNPSERDWQQVIKLAQDTPTFNRGIEQFFLKRMPNEKATRDRWFIEQQNHVHKLARGLDNPQPVQNCLLLHLMLVYYKKEAVYHEKGIPFCDKMIADTLHKLGANTSGAKQ